MYRKILVPVPGYSLPESVISCIIDLARKFHVWEVDFISVININDYSWILGQRPREPLSYLEAPDVYREMIRNQEVRAVKTADYLRILISEINKEGIEARSFVIIGEASESNIILNFVLKHGIGLIIMSADEHYRKLCSALSRGLNIAAKTVTMPIMIFIPTIQTGKIDDDCVTCKSHDVIIRDRVKAVS